MQYQGDAGQAGRDDLPAESLDVAAVGGELVVGQQETLGTLFVAQGAHLADHPPDGKGAGTPPPQCRLRAVHAAMRAATADFEDGDGTRQLRRRHDRLPGTGPGL